MGEAKRRKMRGEYPDTTKPNVKTVLLEYPNRWLTDDLGCEPFCNVMSQMVIDDIEVMQGDCIHRHYIAWRALKDLGVDVDFVYGALIGRVGSGDADTFTFGTEDQRVSQNPNGWLGHAWLRGKDGSLIDFTVGRWNKMTAVSHPFLPPLNWQITLPDHFWVIPERTGLITAVKEGAPRKFPKIGEIIYREYGDVDEVSCMSSCDWFLAERQYLEAKPRLMNSLDKHQEAWRGRHNPPKEAPANRFTDMVRQSMPKGALNFYGGG